VPKLACKNGNIQKGNGTISMNISKYFIAHNVLKICSFRNKLIYQNLFMLLVTKCVFSQNKDQVCKYLGLKKAKYYVYKASQMCSTITKVNCTN